MKLPTITFTPKLWPSVMTAIMMMVLLGLCYWQVQRSEWKTMLIRERTERLSLKPEVLDGLPDGDVNNLYFRAAYVTAPVKIARPYYTFSHDPDHGVGFQLYFPETWNKDRWFLRKSDFLTMDEWKSGAYRWPTNDELAKNPLHEQLGIFVPLDDTASLFPLKEKGSEPIRPLSQIEPVIFMPIYEWGGIEHELLKSRLLNIPNNHAAYAITWFFLAIALGVIYLAAHCTIRFKE